MSNERDSGRYDQFTNTTSDTNVRIDFAWGNVPMQPNDDRGEATLDPALDSHIIATSEYEGFPAFITGAPFDDTTPNTTVPNIVGLTGNAADNALAGAGLVASAGSTTGNSGGATSSNDGKVASQTVAAGTTVNVGSTVGYSLYAYVNPGNPIAGMSRSNLPEGWTLNGGDIVMYLVGRTVKPVEGGTPVVITGNSNDSLNQTYNVGTVANDDHYNSGGTAVKLTALAKVYVDPDTNEGGVWTLAY